MSLLSTSTLIIAGAGVLVGLVLARRGHPRGSAITAIAAIVCVTVGACTLIWPGAIDAHPAKTNETAFAAIAAERLGAHLAEHYAGANVVVILPFEWRTSAEQRTAMSAGLQRGLAGKVTLSRIIDPPLPPAVKAAYQSAYNLGAGEDGDAEQAEVPDLTTWFTAAYLDRLLTGQLPAAEPGQATIIVSLAGLPEDSANLAVLKGTPKPKLAMAFGPVHALHRLIARGELVAATDHHPSPLHHASSPEEDVAAAFSRRYLLITPNNLTELKRQHPTLY